MHSIAAHMRDRHDVAEAGDLVEAGNEAREHAEQIRKLIVQREPLPARST
jgi:hypothetical protein